MSVIDPTAESTVLVGHGFDIHGVGLLPRETQSHARRSAVAVGPYDWPWAGWGWSSSWR